MDNLYEQIDIFGGIKAEKQPIEREVLIRHLKHLLQNLTLDEFVSLITNKFTETIEYVDLSRDERACQKTSLLFNPHRLEVKTKSSSKSLYDALKTDSFISGLCRVILLKKDNVNELLYQSMQMGINGIQYVNEFPPHVARKIAKQFNVDANSRVLDPCAGWGGRMLGISTVCNYYQAYDPSTQTYAGLLKLCEFIKTMNSDFKANVFCECFEDAIVEENSFDFAITSPPYYDTEEYCDEETNSLNRYSNFQKWADWFYIPMIEKTLRALKNEKTFVLNIGSRKYPLNQILKDTAGKRCEIVKLDNFLSGNSSGLGKTGEGETFYAITKR